MKKFMCETHGVRYLERKYHIHNLDKITQQFVMSLKLSTADINT